MTDLLAIAGAPAAHIEPPHPKSVFGEGFILSPYGPLLGAVQGVDLDDDAVEAAVEATRALARERGWEGAIWWLTDRSRPADLADRIPFTEELEPLSAMAIERAPDVAANVEVTRVEDVEDFVLAQSIDLACMGWSEEQIDEAKEGQRANWEHMRETFMLWLARVDGEPAGFARAARADGALMLIGAGTLEWARGRGVYRSLVCARWQTAVELGRPALVVQANGESGPILDRLGFERIGQIRLLVDRL